MADRVPALLPAFADEAFVALERSDKTEREVIGVIRFFGSRSHELLV
jgi:hypothetical protein